MQANTLVIITGVAGSGKSTALNAFEDMGFFCVDNLPAPLIPNFVDFLKDVPPNWSPGATANQGERSNLQKDAQDEETTKAPSPSNWRFALLADCRDKSSFDDVSRAMLELRSLGTEVILLFFDCADEAIIHRFRETRRPHPLMLQRPDIKTLEQAVSAERMTLAPLRGLSSRVVDTSGLSPHDLRRSIEGLFQHQNKLEITLTSFGFKYGPPVDVDMIMDVRFLPNPHFVEDLKDKPGTDDKVKAFVLDNNETKEFLDRYLNLLEYLLPRYLSEGKRYLTIGVGCTGGRHRSVAISVALQDELQKRNFSVFLRHRDITRNIC